MEIPFDYLTTLTLGQYIYIYNSSRKLNISPAQSGRKQPLDQGSVVILSSKVKGCFVLYVSWQCFVMTNAGALPGRQNAKKTFIDYIIHDNDSLPFGQA